MLRLLLLSILDIRSSVAVCCLFHVELRFMNATLTITSPPGPRKVLDPAKFQEFRLEKKTEVSHNVTIYRFALPRPTDILGLPIGQHISLAANIPGQPKEVVRSYTPISSDNDSGYFDLLVKAYPQGNISKYLTTLEVGDNMKVRGPKGAFVYTPNMCRRIGMIAGGTGVTPMLQVVKAIIRNRPRNGGNDTTQVDLIFANVNPEDILLKDELERLAKEDDGFRIYYVLNNPPSGWTGGVGFVTADMIKVSPSHQSLLRARPSLRYLLICVFHRNVFPLRQATSRSSSAGLLPWSAP